MIFVLVGIAGYRRRRDTGSNSAIVVVAIAVTAVVLGFFAVDTCEPPRRPSSPSSRSRS